MTTIAHKPGWLNDILAIVSAEPGDNITVWMNGRGELEIGKSYATPRQAQAIATRLAGDRNCYVVTCYSDASKVLTSGGVVLAHERVWED